MSESQVSGSTSEVLGSLKSLAESINVLEVVTIELLAILLVAQAMGGDPPDATVSDFTKTLTERLQRDRESTLDKVKHLLEAGTFTLEQLQAILST